MKQGVHPSAIDILTMHIFSRRIQIPSVLKKMHEIFSRAGFSSYLVGGAVRDMLMGKQAHDYDVATDAKPDDVTRLFHRVIPTGIEHGTVTVRLMGHSIEVTTFRTESAYTDGRHPDHVLYAPTIEDDLSRRDFTMNAIAAHLADGKLVDPFDGAKDIRKKVIRAVGNPHERFCEDGLRPIRAIRFAAQLEFRIENHTYSDIFEEDTRKTVAKISIERFRDEFVKMLSVRTPSRALKMLEETGITSLFIPELLAGRNCIQSDGRGFHEFDVLDHMYYACDGAPRENLTARLAALFHDIGKPASRTVEKTANGELYHFYGHDALGANMTRTILARLRFPTKTVDAVAHLVKEHMFHYEDSWSDAAVRRFIVRVGSECLNDLFDVRRADIYGMHRAAPRLHDTETGKNLLALKTRIASVQAQKTALSIKDLAVNGNDLIGAGIPAGKELGHVLKELFNTVLDDPTQNTREHLLTIAKNIYARLHSCNADA